MGTRHLTVVVKDNKIKLSQYGQWDGYYSGQGKTFTNFVRNHLKNDYDFRKFSEMVDILKPVKDSYYDSLLKHFDEINKNKEFSIPLSVMFPQFSRDTGANILYLLANQYASSYDGRSFPVALSNADWCEFAYVINLDTKEVYMFTDWEFDASQEQDTPEFIRQNLGGLKCWYKSSIKDLPSVSTIKKYNKQIGLNNG